MPRLPVALPSHVPATRRPSTAASLRRSAGGWRRPWRTSPSTGTSTAGAAATAASPATTPPSRPASENDGDAPDPNPAARRLASYTGHADVPRSADDGGGDGAKSRRIIDRESDYRRRRLDRALSPDRHDAFAAGEATPAPSVRTY
ncbi:hypothetical protein ZWY2020_051877 [Hordeum vulgare]|nr:hypothetical protein ZWY2020_051877 [Hordeum vulgare]